MANYRQAQQGKFSKDEEKRFRELFNKWGASVEGYNRKRLGNELRIVEVWDSPIYRGELKTQYDRRILKDDYERINGRSFPNSKYVSEDGVDRWSIVERPTTFTNKEDIYRVRGTEHIVTCPTCRGTGNTTCENCRGKGTITRTIDKRKQCTKCRGYGYIYVTKYREEPTITYYTGKREVRREKVSYSEKATCPDCGGKGEVGELIHKEEPCSNCRSTGRVICRTCSGEKQMLRIWKLHRAQEVGRYAEYLFPHLIEGPEANKIVKQFDSSIQWQVVENIHIDGENFDKANLGSRPVVGHMLTCLPQRGLRHQQHTAICFNDVEVSECGAKTVIYEVDGKRYTCMLVGEQWKLFAVTSPISDKMDSLKEQVNSYCSRRQYGKAWGVLQKINKYPQTGSAEANMQELLEKRMAITTKLGANFAVVICTMLSIPLFIQLFDTFDFFAIWTKWIMDACDVNADFVVVISSILVLFLGMQSRKSMPPKFSYRVVSPVRRFLRGFIVGVCDFLKWFAIVAIGGYLGIVHLVGGLFMLCLSIIGFIILIILGLISLIF